MPTVTFLTRLLPFALLAATLLAADLSPADSDPVKMGWMIGSPPSPEKLIRYDDGSYRQFPQSRWSFSNIRQFQPTRQVKRGHKVLPLAKDEDARIDKLTFTPAGGAGPVTFADALTATYTDSLIVLHKGRIVYERYFGVAQPDQPHVAFSVTKSFIATVAAMLIAEKRLDENTPVETYVPEVMHSGFRGVTIRQLLDMRSGIKHNEDYTAVRDIDSPMGRWRIAAAAFPCPPGYTGPASFYQFLAQMTGEVPPGDRFLYQTPNTVMLAWVLERVSGKAIGELISERIWQPAGMEFDGYFSVDAQGTCDTGGGLNLTLRDLARFGEFMRGGRGANGLQAVPAAIVEDIKRGGDRAAFGRNYPTKKGWSYRTMWWVTHNDHGAFEARGIHGQALRVDQAAEVVIAKFSSNPLASGASYDPLVIGAFDAVVRHLMSRP